MIEFRDSDAVEDDFGGSNQPNKDIPNTSTPILDNFSRDLTTLASEGKLDPVIGRTEEVKRLVQILSRRKKNNPVLIGEPGVGKTSVVEMLATIINSGKCPRTLVGKRIVLLELSSLVLNTVVSLKSG